MTASEPVGTLERAREAVVDAWLAGGEAAAILSGYDIDPVGFKHDFALHIIDHFVRVLREEERIGQCPYMIEFVLFLKDRNVRMSEMAALCLALRCEVVTAVIPALSEDGAEGIGGGLRRITDAFDASLIGILRFFDAALSSKEGELQEYLRIVDQHVPISKTDPRGVITYVNESFCRVCGYAKEELIGRSHNILRHPDMPASVYARMWETISSGRLWKGEIKNRAKDGHPYWISATISPLFDKEGSISGYMSVRRDVSDRVLAFTDALTAAPNRRKFDETVSLEMERVRRYGGALSLALLDVDDFKRVNDTFGHERGDSVLREMAEIIRPTVRETDLFARWGGEEFVILLTGTPVAGALRFALKLRDTVAAHTFDAVGRVTCSLGVSQFRPGDTPQTMFSRADDGLYRAKRGGRNRVVAVDDDGVSPAEASA